MSVAAAAADVKLDAELQRSVRSLSRRRGPYTTRL